MSDILKATEVEALGDLSIRVAFSDGAVKEVDLSDLLGQGGVFAPIRESRSLFDSVRVNAETGAVEWPGEVDLDPEVLYGRFEPASGASIRRRTVRAGGS